MLIFFFLFFREDSEADQHDALDLSDSLVLLNAGSTAPALNSLVYDVLYRPAELEDLPMWDQIGDYEKVRQKNKSRESVTSRDSDSEFAEDRANGNCSFRSTNPFLTYSIIQY